MYRLTGIAFMALFCALMSSSTASGHAFAQSDPGCTHPETVACLSLDAYAGSGGTVSGALDAALSGVFTAINHGNYAYMTAVGGPDLDNLRAFFTDDAYASYASDVTSLQSRGNYRVTRLVETQLVDWSVIDVYSNARVHTHEHWVSTTYSNGGGRISSSDAWWENQYYLRPVNGGGGNRFLIYTDVFTPA